MKRDDVGLGVANRAPLIERVFAGHHDVLAALRSLRRSPGFVAIAVLSLGLAIGLTTTAFALFAAIRTPYLPYERPEELLTVSLRPLPYQQAHDAAAALRERRDLYREIVPFRVSWSPIEVHGRVVGRTSVEAGADLFRVLGVRPVAGRAFDSGADEESSDAPAVISYQLWEDAFARDPRLERLSITVGTALHRVIGVMGPTMRYPYLTDVWLPLPRSSTIALGVLPNEALIRLPASETVANVRAKLDALGKTFAVPDPHRPPRSVYAVKSESHMARPLTGLHYAMTGVAALILIVACFNLANLMLARSLGRRREIAMRMAVGATGAAIVRYVLAECAVLGVVGGLWGMMLSLWGVWLLQHHMPPELKGFGFMAPHLGWGVFAFAAGTTVATVLLAGLGPALRARRADVNDALKDGGTTAARKNRSYSLLVIAEVAMSLVVLSSAGLLARSAHRAATLRFGYDAEHLYTAAVSGPTGFCSKNDTLSSALSDLAGRVTRVPGVRFAAAATWRGTGTWINSLPGRPTFAGRGVMSDAAASVVDTTVSGYDQVTPDFYRAYGIDVSEGRNFEAADVQSPGVAIIDRAVAARLWPFESPVGHSLRLGLPPAPGRWVRVVGVVGSRQPARNSDVVTPAFGITVVHGGACGWARIVLRANDDNPDVPVVVDRVLGAAMPGGSITPTVAELRTHRVEIAARTMVAITFGAFALFALALSAAGVYGVLNYAVGQRMREFATRVALGAAPRDLHMIVLRDALVMVLGGTAIGALCALGFGMLLGDGWARGVGSFDAYSLVAAEIVIITVSLAACLGPAIRASRADPLQIMRAT